MTSYWNLSLNKKYLQLYQRFSVTNAFDFGLIPRLHLRMNGQFFQCINGLIIYYIAIVLISLVKTYVALLMH